MHPCTVSLTPTNTRITWTKRPVLFLPLAYRQTTELPACTYDFRPQQTDFLDWFKAARSAHRARPSRIP
jgi:hypothetical protein